MAENQDNIIEILIKAKNATQEAFAQIDASLQKIGRPLVPPEMTAIEKAFKDLNVKSSAEIKKMRTEAVNNFNIIKGSGTASANEIMRAEQARNKALTDSHNLEKGQHTEKIGLFQSLQDNWLKITAAIYTTIKAYQFLIGNNITLAESFLLMSEKTGIAVEDMAGMKFVMEQSETSVESFVAGMKFFNKTLAGTNEEGKNTSEILKDLGISAKAPKEAFLQTVGALSSMEDVTKRNKIILDLFGRSGLDLVNVLNMERSELEKLINTGNRQAGMTKKQAQELDAFGDSIGKLKNLLQGFSQSLGSGLIKHLDVLVFVLGGAALGAAPAIITAIGVALTTTAGAIIGVGVAWALVGATFAAIGIAIGTAIDWFQRWVGLDWWGVQEALDLQKEAIEENIELREKLNEKIKALGLEGIENQEQFNEAIKNGTLIKDAETKKWIQIDKEKILSSAEVIAQLDLELKAIDSTYKYETSILQKAYSDGKISLENYTAEKLQMQEAYIASIIALKEKEIEALNKEGGTENKAKIEKVQQEIIAIKQNAMVEQLKITDEGYKGEQKIIEDSNKLKLDSMKAQADVENALNESLVAQGFMTQSEA